MEQIKLDCICGALSSFCAFLLLSLYLRIHIQWNLKYLSLTSRQSTMFIWVILGNSLAVITAEDADKVTSDEGNRSLAKPRPCALISSYSSLEASHFTTWFLDRQLYWQRMRGPMGKPRQLRRLLKLRRLRTRWRNVQPVFWLEARPLRTPKREEGLLPLSPTARLGRGLC